MYNQKTFGAAEHCAIDYAFVATLVLAPQLFHLPVAARALCYAFGGAAGGLTALTAQPLAVKPVIPFRVHGRVDTLFVPTLLLLPWMMVALDQRNARRFFFAFFGVVVTVHNS